MLSEGKNNTELNKRNLLKRGASQNIPADDFIYIRSNVNGLEGVLISAGAELDTFNNYTLNSHTKFPVMMAGALEEIASCTQIWGPWYGEIVPGECRTAMIQSNNPSNLLICGNTTAKYGGDGKVILSCLSPIFYTVFRIVMIINNKMRFVNVGGRRKVRDIPAVFLCH